ncbi:MAG: 16S rRNA processing protein RimM [Armatimonadetes bacterium]|nr:16S rRNA processing protein RimM [Armatimonadota bacterium]NIO76144.1 16S rRNA processing protein RimM [Armatimonadota bacterium]NIO98840.1 16S rRNA processing protein RimM [Armatimonadota bacterium]
MILWERASTTHREPKLFSIGRISGTFGWAGEVKVHPETDFPERFLELREAWIESPDGSRRRCHVESARQTASRIRLKFTEYSCKEEAAALRGSLILIAEEQLVQLPEGHFFLHQILGLYVRSTEGADLGKITRIIRAPANDVYVTPQVDIPARKEVIREVDLERGIMVVDMSGLKEVTDFEP